MATKQEVAEKAKGQKVVTVFDFLDQKKDLIAKALPQSITPDRLIGVFTMVLKSSPELAKCSQQSLIAAVIQTVQLGLTPGNIGHCHYVPFNSKQGPQVQFMIGYKGIVELVNRCGKATLLSTECVYENDHFEYELGLNPVLKHKPTTGERGPFKGVYCVAKNLVGNEKVFVYLTSAEIDKVKNASKAASSQYSPWNTWFEEMAKKTVIKRICKLLPLSVDDQRHIAQDETVKTEISEDMASVKDEAQWEGETIEVEQTEQPPQEEKQDERLVTEPQIKRLFAIAKSKNWSVDDVDQHIKDIYGYESKKDIQRFAYEDICNDILENPKEKDVNGDTPPHDQGQDSV